MFTLFNQIREIEIFYKWISLCKCTTIYAGLDNYNYIQNIGHFSFRFFSSTIKFIVRDVAHGGRAGVMDYNEQFPRNEGIVPHWALTLD